MPISAPASARGPGAGTSGSSPSLAHERDRLGVALGGVASCRGGGQAGEDDGEGRAFPRCALERDRAAELSHEPPHDVEPEPAAAEAPRVGSISLSEHLEDELLVLVSDADPRVGYAEDDGLRVELHLGPHRAALGEFEAVVDQVPD